MLGGRRRRRQSLLHAVLLTVLPLLSMWLPSVAVLTLTIATTTITTTQVVVQGLSLRTTSLNKKRTLPRLNRHLFPRKQQSPKVVFSSSSSSSSSSSYVPDGLTAREYDAIKKQEAEKETRMNYGAWGPRFARSSSAPSGDWMVMPLLWTRGVVGNSDPNGDDAVVAPRRWAVVQKKLPGFLVALGAVHTVAWAVVVTLVALQKHWPSSSRHAKILAAAYEQQSLLVVGCCWFFGNAVVSALFAKLTQRFVVERINRRWLWSPRQTVTRMWTIVVLLWSALLQCTGWPPIS